MLFEPSVIRHYIADLAIEGAKISRCGRMCSTCAFKRDSEANLEPHNVGAALESLAYDAQFNCHIESGVDAGRICVGYQHAKQYLKHKERKMVKPEYIAPYFQHGLKATFKKDNEPDTTETVVGTIHAIYSDGSIICYDTTNSSPDDYYLLLRPVSDTLKEIEVDGKWFVPAEIMWSVDAEEEEAFKLYGEIPEYWQANYDEMVKSKGVSLVYYDMGFLAEWHIDMFGLIPTGQAKNLNEYKNEISRS